MPAVSNPVR